MNDQQECSEPLNVQTICNVYWMGSEATKMNMHAKNQKRFAGAIAQKPQTHITIPYFRWTVKKIRNILMNYIFVYLVSPKCDAHPKVVRSYDLHHTGVLCVGQSHPAWNNTTWLGSLDLIGTYCLFYSIVKTTLCNIVCLCAHSGWCM